MLCSPAYRGRLELRTFGLTHIGLLVSDPERSFRFYERVLGAKLLGGLAGRENSDLSNEDSIEWGTPGAHDVVTLNRGTPAPSAGITHFGFRLVRRDDPDAVAAEVTAAGGIVTESGHFESSGEPVVFATDPDGYEIEFWFEADPAWRRG